MVLALARPSEAWCFPPGGWFFRSCFSASSRRQQNLSKNDIFLGKWTIYQLSSCSCQYIQPATCKQKTGRTTPRISNVTTLVSTPIWNRLTRVKSWNQPRAAPAVVLKSLHTSLSLHMASHHQVCGHTAFHVELFSCCSRIVLLDCYITLQYIT